MCVTASFSFCLCTGVVTKFFACVTRLSDSKCLLGIVLAAAAIARVCGDSSYSLFSSECPGIPMTNEARAFKGAP